MGSARDWIMELAAEKGLTGSPDTTLKHVGPGRWFWIDKLASGPGWEIGWSVSLPKIKGMRQWELKYKCEYGVCESEWGDAVCGSPVFGAWRSYQDAIDYANALRIVAWHYTRKKHA